MALVGADEPEEAGVVEAVPRVWFDEHAADLFRYAARRVGGDVAEDVLAETFSRGIESLASFDPSRGSVRGWLFGIATNVLRKHRRAEARRFSFLASRPTRAGGSMSMLSLHPRTNNCSQLRPVASWLPTPTTSLAQRAG